MRHSLLRMLVPCAALAVLLLLSAMPAAAAAEPAIVGTWNCSSTTADGNEVTFTLIVKSQDGKLAASVEDSSMGDITVSNLKADGNDASFSAEAGGASYSVKLSVKGAALEGTFEGDQATGTIKGTKKS